MTAAAPSMAGFGATAEPEFVVNKWFVAVAVALGALLEIIDTSIVNVALTDMQASLSVTLSEVGWVVTSYGIANVIILPLSAWLGHRFGKKRYFLFSLIGFITASILCGLSTSIEMLIISRIIQGLTGGGLMAKAQAILFETFPKSEQAMAQAFFGIIVIAGPAIGPTLGGYITTNIGWRWIFFINLPIGIVGIFLTIAALAPDKAKDLVKSKVDWLAIGLLALGIGCFQTFLEQGNEDDWFDSRFIITLAVVAVVSLTCFVLRTLASKAPVVDLKVLRYRSLWSGSLLSVVVGMALYGGLFAIPIFAQTILGYTSQQTGMMLLPGAIASAFTMPIAGKVLATAKDPRRVLVFGAVVLTIATYMFTKLSPQTTASGLAFPLIVRSFGTVFMFLPLSMAAIGPIPKEDVSAASGFYNLTRQLGGSIGIAVLTTLLAKREAFHYNVLCEKVAANAPLTLDRVSLFTHAMMGKGSPHDQAEQRAIQILSGSVRTQAAVLSFADTFWCTCVLILCAMPLVFLLGKPEKGVKVDAGH